LGLTVVVVVQVVVMVVELKMYSILELPPTVPDFLLTWWCLSIRFPFSANVGDAPKVESEDHWSLDSAITMLWRSLATPFPDPFT
jgi:hypothetical protein